MGKIAFVFSGQGDQYPGMGKGYIRQSIPSRRQFMICATDFVPEHPIQCFNGTEEELKETKNTQPCLFATELAAASVLKEKGIVPSCGGGVFAGRSRRGNVCRDF